MKYLEGKKVAERIKARIADEVSTLHNAPRLGIVVVGTGPVTEKFISLKVAFARDVGIETRRYDFPDTITTNALRAEMKNIVHETRNDGIIVQLPLPSHIDTQSILNAITPEKDVDVLSARAVGDYQVGKSKIRPPVAGAVEELFRENHITVAGKKTTLIGYGRLVGQPLVAWLLRERALVTIIGAEEHFDPTVLRASDIVISGVGKPKLITGDLIREGAVLVDVGVSDVAGTLVGDIDIDSVGEKAAYMTPARGGVGPLTVAILFENLCTLVRARM